MRRLFSTLFVLAAVSFAGCRNQANSTFTNPFLTPDRVPPPSTRALAPGTAQPYYPGDPAPVAAPALGAPAAGVPTYGPGATLPPTSQPLTTPPGGWGASAPQSSLSPTPQRLTSREVTPAEYMASPTFVPGATLASAQASGDGFRPQGSQRQTVGESDSSFRPPEIRRDSAATSGQAESSQYAAGANHEWLRGQLEYWPATGQWSVRYLPQGSPADQVGGRVMIENPQVLANLSPGELVMVQGQLFAKPTDAGAVAPAYRIAAVQRQLQ